MNKTCESKIRYQRPRGCIATMKKIIASGKIVDRLGFYKCPECERYHLTTKFGEKKEGGNVQ